MPSPQAAGNTPPFAYFQDVTVYVGETADVTLFACDPDLGVDYVGLSWAITAQPAYGFLSTPYSGVYDGQPFQVAYTPGQVGTDRFVYWVSDGEAWSNTAEVRVEVLDWPAGLLVGGPGSAVENTVVTFTAGVLLASGGTADVTAAAAWSEDSPYASFGAPGQLTVGEVPSDQLVTVTATYSLNGRSAAGTLSVAISNINLAPVADTGTLPVTQDTVAYGTLTGSDPDGGPSPLTFELVTPAAKGAVSIMDSSSGAYAYSPYGGQTGADAFSFRVYDGQDYSPAATVLVNIAGVNAPPAPAISATSSAYEGDVVSFDGTINDPDGPAPYGYILDFGDGGSLSGTTSSNAIAGTHVYLVDNYSGYTVTLTVTDGLGASAFATHSIQIRNYAPMPAIVAPSTASVGESVLFDVIENDPVDTVFVYQWDFENDGTYDAFIKSPVHAFPAASIYTVYIQVGDGTGWGTDTHLITVTPAPSVASTLYVDGNSPAPPAGQDGLSWATALDHPQKAMDAASVGTVILVAKGTYFSADTTTGAPVLIMYDGIDVQGGWCTPGDDSCIQAYDPATNVTILDGDWTGDGTGDIYHVVVGASGAVLDGFSVVNGAAAGNLVTDMEGGGLYAAGAVDLVISNCNFSDNFATLSGGAIYSLASSISLANCVFTNNTTAGGDGGAVFVHDPVSLDVSGSVFDSNAAQGYGGAIAFNHTDIGGGSLNVTGTQVTGNNSLNYAGGISVDRAAQVRITGSVFDGNTAGLGPGGVRISSAPAVISRSRFSGNVGRGGSFYGGGLLANGAVSVVDISNSAFVANSANYGSGILVYNNAQLSFANGTFSGNHSSSSGAALQVSAGVSHADVVNSILWGDNNAEILGSATVTYSDVFTGAAPWAGTGNIMVDPAFADTVSLALSPGSPCIDSGDNGGVVGSYDIGGRPRIFDGDSNGTATVDMGAWEWIPSLPPEGRLFFSGADGGGDLQLVAVDQLNGYSIIATVTGGLDPRHFTAYNSRLYFAATTPGGQEAIASWDGYSGLIIWDSRANWNPRDLTVYDGLIYFAANQPTSQPQLWMFDETNGVAQVSTTLTDDRGLEPSGLTIFGGRLYFAGYADSTANYQVMYYDSQTGTIDTATRVTPGSTFGGLAPGEFTVGRMFDGAGYDTRLYFRGNASDGNSFELYALAEDNTLSQITTLSGKYILNNLVMMDGRLFYRGYLSSASTQTDICSYHPLEGTVAWTGAGGSNSDWLTPYEGLIYMNEYNPSSGGNALYSFEPIYGEALVHDTAAYSGLDPWSLTPYDNSLYFVGYDDLDTQYLWGYNLGSGAFTVNGTAGLQVGTAAGTDEHFIVFNPDAPPVADVQGLWTVVETVGSNTCGDPTGPLPAEPVVVTQHGNALVLEGYATWNAVMEGDTITAVRTYLDDPGVTTESMVLVVNPAGTTISGASGWSYTYTNTCTGNSTYSGTRAW